MFRKRARTTALLLTFTLCICMFSLNSAWAAPEKVSPSGDKKASPSVVLETTAESALLMDAVSGKVLFAKDPEKELPMASVTKLMTLLLAVEAIDQGKAKLTDRVVTSENAWGMGGSQVYLEPGEEFSMEEMLVAIAVGSANDASVAVAEHLGGSEEAFVQTMNDKAKSLGLKHTHFANPTGLPAEGHYTSAHDMAVILQQCLKYPLFRKVSSIYEHDFRGGEFKLWSTNKLLKWYKGCDAGKTGWTNEAKYCLASSAEREGLRLIAVVLGTPEPKSHFRESIKLFNYGFAKYKAVKMAEKGAKIKTLPVGKGTLDHVDVITSDKVSVVVPKGQDKGFSAGAELPEQVTAPVAKGQKIGSYVVMKDGQEVLRVPLVAKQEVQKAGLMRQMNKVFNKLYGGN